MPYRLRVLSMGVAAGSILIAILALVISLASGIAQVVQWQRSGPRVKVAATMSIPYGAIADVGPPATVNATNSGRHPTTVNMWGFEIAGANGESVIDPHGGVFSPPLPHRLDAHSNADFRTPIMPMLQSLIGHGCGPQTQIVPFVDLPTGRVRGKPCSPRPSWWREARDGGR